MKGGGFALGRFDGCAEHFRRARLIKADGPAVTLVVIAQRLKNAQRAEPDHICSVLGLLE
jgi:hypothetical protein